MSRVQKVLQPLGLDWIRDSEIYRNLRSPGWSFSARARSSRAYLKSLQNAQAGEHGFIVGTGPSLNRTDLSLIGDRPTIGLNRLFLGFETLGFKPSFHLCINLLMIEQSAEQLMAQDVPIICAWAAHRHLRNQPNIHYVRTCGDATFHTDLTDRISTGGTVTYAAMQLAYWLGWRKLTLLGIDHHYTLQPHEKTHAPHDVVVRQDEDLNHFTADYMPKGKAWQMPDLKSSEAAYRHARHVFEQDKREIEDGTVGGKLTVFSKVATYSRDLTDLKDSMTLL